MPKDVVSVTPSDPYRLNVLFEDGVEGVVALDEMVQFHGVFELLRDPEEFRKVSVHPELNVVSWPNGADLDSEVLYHRILGTDWVGMREAAQSSATVFRSLFTEYRSSTSSMITGWLIGVITNCRRKDAISPQEAIGALIELTKKPGIWQMFYSTPTGLVNHLHSAIYEEGLPEGADFRALADFIHESILMNTENYPAPQHELDVAIASLCTSLAFRDGLLPALLTRPGAKEEAIQALQSILRNLAGDQFLNDSYGPGARLAIESLQRFG